MKEAPTSEVIEFGGSEKSALPIFLKTEDELFDWSRAQGDRIARWIETALPAPSAGAWCFLPGEDGPSGVVTVVESAQSAMRALASLAQALPKGRYCLAETFHRAEYAEAAYQFSAGAYRYTRYRASASAGAGERAVLVLPEEAAEATPDIRALELVRDLVNAPADDLGPDEIADEAKKIAEEFGGELRVVRGDELAAEYPLVWAVGRAASRPPLLVDLRFGDPQAPKLTIAGKGVCFDSGGLDIKPADGMRHMKKDMGGAAHALGLAQAVLARELPVRLRVLVPAVENAIAGDAYRPGDILRSRKGLTVEIHNTDAEGRVILADALADAAAEDPDLLLDFATLTGAARVALGPDIPALFSPADTVADGLVEWCGRAGEPLWRLPLYTPYRALLDSPVADMTNAASGRHAGAITAALFLAAFADDAPRWAHVDLYAWNDSAKPGRPAGGEGQCLRGIAAYLSARYAR